MRFESVRSEFLFDVLDAISWLDMPDQKQITQFAGIAPQTTGKIIKNCATVGLIQQVGNGGFALTLPYPYKGSVEQKTAVVREALVKMPLMVHFKQFEKLGEKYDSALRKAATVVGVQNYDPESLAPLLKWAKEMGVLDSELAAEDLVNQAVSQKEQRHSAEKTQIVAFLSHSTKDKPFVRQLAADLNQEGITVWLDEQRILVGDSITEKIGQGLAQSDFFLIALSKESINSEWVKKELNQALITEVEKREVHILPVKLSDCEIPPLIKDKKYADFSTSYKQGLADLVAAMRSRRKP